MNTNRNPLLATFGAGWEEMLDTITGKRMSRKAKTNAFRRNKASKWDIKQGPLHQASSRRVFPH
jgi:hypothetical protein